MAYGSEQVTGLRQTYGDIHLAQAHADSWHRSKHQLCYQCSRDSSTREPCFPFSRLFLMRQKHCLYFTQYSPSIFYNMLYIKLICKSIMLELNKKGTWNSNSAAERRLYPNSSRRDICFLAMYLLSDEDKK